MASAIKKRLRIFAGPNGSGKSTITKIVFDYVHLGTYVNADELKIILSKDRFIDFVSYGLHLNEEKFREDFLSSTLASKIDNIQHTLSNVVFDGDKLFLMNGYDIEDYFVSFITAFIWNELLDCSKKFTIETVMSHPSKLNFMRKAQEKGFKVYLYFVALADPELNKHRVQTRIAQGGHPVAEEKISERYYRTMENLYDALKIADSAYLFDNSAGEPNMFAVKKNGTIEIEADYIPKWFETYVIQKL
jgi:predicted ABC-type ATPase